MRCLLLALYVITCIFAATIPCFADATHGVLAQERVINLPSDQGKWHVSVVGDTADPQYQTIIKWFDTNASLRNLKNRVHFCPVTTNRATYQERYASNIKGLPTVRFQQPDGVVVYEAADSNLPFTAEGLYGAMANAVAKTQCRPILPWRRNCVPTPDPAPSPTPEPVDPEPQPIDDSAGPPIDTQSNLPPVWLMALILILSAGLGGGKQWWDTYVKK